MRAAGRGFVPGQQLSVQHAAVGQRHRGLFDLGEAAIQPFLAA
jgi:hypothetical protein